MVAVDLAISKETDTFHPHKQTRLYGVTTALSQCPQGNAPCSCRSGARDALWLHASTLPAARGASTCPGHMAGETHSLPSRACIV